MNGAQALFWFKLIRWHNLALAVACLLIFRLVLKLGAKSSGVVMQLGDHGFLSLSLSLVSLMAFGYLLNDLEDEKTDRVNRPDLWDHKLRPSAVAMRRGANIIALSGALMSIGSAWDTGLWGWLWLYPAIYLVLWSYTRFLKPHGLVANIIVALMIALVPLVLLIPEWSWVRHASQQDSSPVLGVFLLFALFAFCGNLFRELVKDLEDLPGDSEAGIRTLPVRIGLIPSLAITVISGMAFSLVLFWIGATDPWHLNACPAFLSMAVIQGAMSLTLIRVRDTRGFRRISQTAKWHQAAGLILALTLGILNH